MRALPVLVAIAWSGVAQASEWSLWTETQFIGMRRNDVGLPGDTGTRFPFSDLTGRGWLTASRWTLVYAPERGGEWRLMVAPFSFSGTGSLRQTTSFEGADFAAGTPTKGTYRFNSYRLTWRNRWREGWSVGATLKVRDAEIAMRQGALSRSKTDLGVVPLLHVYGEQPLGGPWTLSVDFDGAWSPMGRAADLGVALLYAVDPRTELSLGYRVLEGGVDNSEVYTFSQFESITFGVRVAF